MIECIKKYKYVFLLAIGIGLVFLMLPHCAFASAGGGDAFDGGSGGGFGGGSFGGGGYGGNGGFFFLPFVFGGGGGGSWWIIILVLVFLVPYMIRRFGPNTTSPQQGRGMWQRPIVTPDADLSVITNKDPGFSEPKFIDKVESMFFAIQKAWMAKDLTTVRAYMTDAQYQRLQVQIDDMNRRKVTNMLEEMAVGSVKPIRVEVDESYETIVCAIWASMLDYKIDDTTKKVVEGDNRNARKFTEYWTFMRSVNAKTKPVDALVTKTCPNCGAPLDINEFGKCNYCQAYVISGDFDWVLSDISQVMN